MPSRTSTPTDRCRKWRRRQPALTRLEDRTVPNGTSYLPPSQFIVNQDFAVSATRPFASSLEAGKSFVLDYADEFNVTPTELANAIVTDQYTDADTGVSHIYLRQRVRGLEVANANLAIAVAANGSVISSGGGFVRDLGQRLADEGLPATMMSPDEAVRFAAAALTIDLDESPIVINPVHGPIKTHVVSAPSVSLDDIPAQLHYVPTPDGSAALAWQLIVRTLDGDHWYDLSIDVQTGDVIAQSDWVAHADYHVAPAPNESPTDGGFGTLTNPADATASPFGWHDTNGVAGAEFTDTRGNNVDAHLDVNADNAADAFPPRPDGGANLDFSNYTYNIAEQPTTLQNQNAAVVNLFYMNNWIHDVQYKYGFTEVAGNFQTNNYGKGGTGNDAVQADAQDGSGTNNANFSTPPDGNAPRMQMYQWFNTTPARDSDLDNGVIIHEYGHGISNRLTGGPANSNALNTTQSGGMGEGWSDFLAVMMLQRPSDTQLGSYGIGTYLLGQSISGTGIRRFPYSYNMATNPLMWDAYGDASTGMTPYGVTRSLVVHRTGEIWCSTLWDLNWLLINKYGYDPNLSTGWSATAGPGNAGNKLMLRLVLDAMKLQPANPSVINARDAIIAADMALNGGKDLFEIWSAFARRGLGANAATSDGNATTITVDTTMPMLATNVVPANGDIVVTPPASYVVNVSSAIEPTTLQASDLLVNGKAATGFTYTAGQTSVTFTFATNPVIAEGTQTIQINAGAFNRASDSVAVGALNSSFTYDASPLIVTSITPTAGAIVTVPLTTIDVNFNTAVNPASVQTGDISITQGLVTGFSLLNSDKTIRFSVANLVNEGTMYVHVAEGAVQDLQGNPNAVFSGGLIRLDFNTIAFPTPLIQRNVPGSLIYDGSEHANIGYPGDTDFITLNLDAGQLLNVVLTSDPNLRTNLSLFGPGTNLNVTAPTPGDQVALSLVPITTAGTYSFSITGVSSTTGDYGLYVQLNLGTEVESGGGANNDSIATAQNIDSLFSSIGGGISRAAIQGRSDLASEPESEPNDTTATANTITKASIAPTDYFQMSLAGELGVGNDGQDYFNIGQLQVGDVITISQSGKYSGRGTLDDALVRLYRAGTPTTILVADDDSGPKAATGGDSLIHRYTVTTDDTYYIRASRFQSSNVGTYQVGVLLQNTGAAPTTGGGLVNESANANGQISTAENASASWRAVQYVGTSSGTISAGDTDIFKYTFTAGDRVSLVLNSNGTLDPQTALLDPLGVALATDDSTGTYAIPGGFASIFGYIIPTTGDYYMRVNGTGGTTGGYTADVYASSSPVPPALPPAHDHYALSLTAGQVVTATVKSLSAGSLDIAVLDSGGAVLTSGVSGATNIDEIAANVVAPTTGTYYLRVSGPRDIDYQVTAVTGGTFDAEANNTFGTAQSLGASRAALGIISGSDDWYSFSAVAGQSYTIATETPGGGPGEFTNNLDPFIELFNPSGVSAGSDNNSAADGRNAVLNFTALVTGDYRVRMTGAAATTGEYLLKVANAVPPPRVTNVVIGDGSVQRSRIDSLTVNFNQVVTLPVNTADAFTLTRHGGGSVTMNAVASNTPNTSVTITFSGGFVDFGSLADGRYTLTVLAGQVSGGGGQLDGDANGVGGDNYVLDSAMTPNAPTNIFRIFGDGNGDGSVSSNDFALFRTVFGLGASIFDFNNDVGTNAADFGQFRARFGTGI